MKTQVYRNLDRPFALLGIKGRYILLAGAAVIASIVIGLVAGTIGNTFVGLAVALVLIVGCYLGILEIQQRFPEKALSRKLGSMSLPKSVTVRSKVWKR